MGLGLIWKMTTKMDVFNGWGRVWLAFGAAVVALAGIQAIRKWRFHRERAAE